MSRFSFNWTGSNIGMSICRKRHAMLIMHLCMCVLQIQFYSLNLIHVSSLLHLRTCDSTHTVFCYQRLRDNPAAAVIIALMFCPPNDIHSPRYNNDIVHMFCRCLLESMNCTISCVCVCGGCLMVRICKCVYTSVEGDVIRFLTCRELL